MCRSSWPPAATAPVRGSPLARARVQVHAVVMADGYWEAKEPDADGWLRGSVSGSLAPSGDEQDGDGGDGVREPLNTPDAPPSLAAERDTRW